jgi:hypothetical protein
MRCCALGDEHDEGAVDVGGCPRSGLGRGPHCFRCCAAIYPRSCVEDGTPQGQPRVRERSVDQRQQLVPKQLQQ